MLTLNHSLFIKSKSISKIDEQYHPMIYGTLSRYFLCGPHINNLSINLLENSWNPKVVSY